MDYFGVVGFFSINVSGGQCIAIRKQLFFDGLSSKSNPCKPKNPQKDIKCWATTDQLEVAYKWNKMSIGRHP